MWVLSDQPSGPDKYIWHYASGTWTNISGEASAIAVRPDGTLYAINSLGAIYAYSGGTWTGIGGTGGSIGAGGDGSIYVTSVGSGDQSLWRYAAGSWSQIPGSGVTIVGSSDAGYYPIGGGTSAPDPVWVTNASGGIYVQSTGGGFGSIGGSASQVAPTSVGGLFALSFPASPSGENLYYYDLSAQSWTLEASSIAGVSAIGSQVCVVNSLAAIYCSPLSYPTPTPTPSPTPTPTPIPPGTVVARYTIPSAGAQPGGIVNGVTGVWFTESATNKIGFLQSGSIHEYSVPTSNAAPAIIDSNQSYTWFGEQNNGTVARIDSTGHITEDAIGAGRPGGIVANADGSVWIAETTLNVLERYAEPNLPQQYLSPHIPTLTTRDYNNGLNMWVTEHDSDAIAVLTSSTFTEYTLPVGSRPMGIVSNSYGTWFAESGTGKIGRWTLGTITQYSLPAGYYPMQIASTGANVWFTTTNGSVGRILPDGTTSIYNVGATGGSSATFGNPIAFGGGYIWVGDASTNSILEIHI